MQKGGMALRHFNGHNTFMDRKEAIEMKKNTFLAPLDRNEKRSYAVGRSPSNLSMTIGLESLDLNTHGDNEAATSCKQLDLNRFSYSLEA